MREANKTTWTEFILVGFSDIPHLKIPLFFTFLIIYLMTISGNLLVMAIIFSDSHLHSPMYFFLTNLSFVDICYMSVTFPKMLASFFLPSTRISLEGCMLQMYFFIAMIAIEIFLLIIMAYDRYAAICNPLRYTTVMSKSVCFKLAAGAWIVGLIEPIFHTVLISQFSFCKSHEINHFFCDFPALMKLSCTSTHTIEGMTYVLSAILALFACLLIIASYVRIVSAIFKMQTSEGRNKAFSTCGSHLTAVILFYGALVFVYIRPASMYSVTQSKILSFVYSGVIPMCNPIIYTLKNKEFKNALKRQIRMEYVRGKIK